MTNILCLIKNLFLRSPNLTSLGTASGISNTIGGLFWFYIASLLGTELYGEVSYFISIAIVVSTVSLLGSANTIIVCSAKKIKLQSTIFIVVTLSAIISSIIIFIFFEQNFGISIFIIGFIIFTILTSDLLGRKLFIKYSKIVISQKFLQVGLSILLYYIFGINGIILGIGISFIPFGLLFLKEFRIKDVDFSLLKTHSGFMANNYFLDITKTLEGSIDKIILLPIIGFSLLGNFQLGIQFLSILTILPIIVFQYTLPHDATGNSVEKIKKIIIIISILLSILAVFLSPILLPIIFPEFTESIIILQILSLALIPVTITSTYVSKFLGMKKSKFVLLGSGIFLLIQIPGIIIFGMYFGLLGATVSILAGRIGESIYYYMINRLIFQNIDN
jgi:O-antigen/teichoic acid export membrane protein